MTLVAYGLIWFMIGISCENGNEPPGSCKSSSSLLPEETLASGRSLLHGVSFWSLYLLSEECLLIVTATVQECMTWHCIKPMTDARGLFSKYRQCTFNVICSALAYLLLPRKAITIAYFVDITYSECNVCLCVCVCVCVCV